jgi:hypothetical protein
MGNSSGKANKRNKDQQIIAKNNRSNATQNTRDKIERVEQVTINNFRNNNTDLVNMSNTHFAQAIMITETAKKQLNREGGPFTKADLIAIVIGLEPSYASNIESLNHYVIKDLNVLIRTIIYDPMRYMNTPNENVQLDNQNQNQNQNQTFNRSSNNEYVSVEIIDQNTSNNNNKTSNALVVSNYKKQDSVTQNNQRFQSSVIVVPSAPYKDIVVRSEALVPIKPPRSQINQTSSVIVLK